jgi:predicted regulator of Ras-like GTPase activity (Roadblock/LC7/MglB family)
MDLHEKIKIHLDQIKQLKGVENVVLTQRDGNPIQSTGVWFSEDEIFNVCSAASAIFNVGIHLHPDDLKYILIEGKKAKILIAPLTGALHSSLNKIMEQEGIINENHEFFIAITAESTVNLGGIFLQTHECLKKIKTSLITSGESFKPPLIQFDNQKIQRVLKGFDVKENSEFKLKISSFSMDISKSMSLDLKKVLNDISFAIPDLKYAFISIDGGFITSKFIKSDLIDKDNLDNISAMCYSVFQTANRCSWLLKKMNTENILIDCDRCYQFIHGLDKAIFCSEISKNRQKLGLLRLILPQFLKKINISIKQTTEIPRNHKFDLKRLLGKLIIK